MPYTSESVSHIWPVKRPVKLFLVSISLLTIVKGRRQHLHNQMRGIRALTQEPSEVVVVHMNEETDPELPDPGCPHSWK